MEIIKQTESFNLKDKNEVFEMTGNVSREVSGSLNVHFSVNKVEGEYVGDCNYNKYGEENPINFSVNCSEEHRDELTAYADAVIDEILEHFKTV